jgi:hypothetical protein
LKANQDFWWRHELKQRELVDPIAGLAEILKHPAARPQVNPQ